VCPRCPSPPSQSFPPPPFAPPSKSVFLCCSEDFLNSCYKEEFVSRWCLLHCDPNS
jgi:hypothetical protein